MFYLAQFGSCSVPEHACKPGFDHASREPHNMGKPDVFKSFPEGFQRPLSTKAGFYTFFTREINKQIPI